MAGINAALKIRGKEPFVVGRDEGYIGVMINDLVTRGVEEPYRLFTSRAEYRLNLRADNADQRLAHYGHKFGLLREEDYRAFERKQDRIRELFQFLKKEKTTLQTGARVTLKEWLKKPEVSLRSVLEYKKYPVPITDEEIRYAEAEVKYEGYLRKQEKEIDRTRQMDRVKLPDDFDFCEVPGLTREVVEKLLASRPKTIGQARGISGMTPAAMVNLSLYVLAQKRGPRESPRST